MLELLVLRGAPGIGKSTVAGLLLEKRRVRAVVEVDTVRKMLAGLNWSDQAQHQTAIECAAALAIALCRAAGGPVALVDALDARHIAGLRGRFDEEGLTATWIGLSASDEVLMARLSGRAKSSVNVDMCRVLNSQMTPGASFGHAFIDTSEMTAAQSADRVTALLDAWEAS